MISHHKNIARAMSMIMFKQVLNQIRLLRRAQKESEIGFEFHYVIMKKTNKQLSLDRNPGPSAWLTDMITT